VVRDPRITNLARILVGYSIEVKEGETCLIEGPVGGESLIAAVYEEVLAAGGNPVVAMSFEGQAATYLRQASEAQLEWISPMSRWAANEADCRIAIGADSNTRELSSIPPERQAKRRTATRELLEATMKRSADGSHRWVYTLFPTSAYASDAEMSLTEFEDFYFRACLADDPDPLTAWKRASKETERLAEWTNGRSEVHVVAEGTDIKLGVEGRRFIPCVGDRNMPDGEFFTGPIEDSVEGVVSFHLPAMIGGREVAGVRLRFESGKVADASAERGEEFLLQSLDSDEGARTLGELGIGTNYGIDRGTRDVLLDEKIGGTVHMALGASYPETGGSNESAIHYDMVCDLRRGGRLEVDGELLQKDGKFVV
jgi:aminopeptidase